MAIAVLNVMGYKLNRDIDKGKNTVYSREELGLMSLNRLKDICVVEHIVKGVSGDLSKKELIDLIATYCNSDKNNLIEKEVEEGVERLASFLVSESVSIVSDESLKVSGKITVYEGASVDFSDEYKLSYKESFINTNAIVVSGENKVCVIFNVVRYAGEKNSLYLIKNATLKCSVSDRKNYSLYIMEKESSNHIYHEYMGEPYERGQEKDIIYKLSLMDFEVKSLVSLNMPVALDFGSTNTTVSIYADSSYFREVKGQIKKEIKENTICHTSFYSVEKDVASKENMIPTVVSVSKIDDRDNIEYVFGKKALWLANLSYTDKGFSVFYDIKRWVSDFERKEEVIDADGKFTYVDRIDIICEFIKYVLNITRDRFKCAINEVYITVPVKQKHTYTELLSIVSKKIDIDIKISLDESTAVLYSFITKMREKGSLEDGRQYKALIMDCGGGTTDLSACKFRVRKRGDIYTYVMENTYKNGDTDFGGNNISYRLMQLLKIKLASSLGYIREDMTKKLLENLPQDTYRYIDEEGVGSFYESIDREYKEIEKYIPTRFKDYETSTRAQYYRVRNNYFFLFGLADEIKQVLFSESSIEITVPEDKNALLGYSRLEADRWKVSYIDDGFKTLERMPKISFNRYEVERLIAGEIYNVMKAFMERLYQNGELYDFDMIRLTGQSCKIGLFKDALKEFVPGNMMHSAGSTSKEELKMACVDGLMKYLYDRKTGYAGFEIKDEEMVVPYKIKAMSYLGREEVLIDGFKDSLKTGSIIRNLEDVIIRLYLCDALDVKRFEYIFNCKIDSAKETDRDILAKEYKGYIRQEDTDDIENDEIKLFVFVDHRKWGFKAVPVFRRKEKLYLGESKEYKFETDEWMLDFFDGEH